MSITIELPADVESRLEAVAAAEGTSAAAILTQLAVNVFGTASGDDGINPDDPDTIREIGEALADGKAAQARGELLTVDEAFQKTITALQQHQTAQL